MQFHCVFRAGSELERVGRTAGQRIDPACESLSALFSMVSTNDVGEIAAIEKIEHLVENAGEILHFEPPF